MSSAMRGMASPAANCPGSNPGSAISQLHGAGQINSPTKWIIIGPTSKEWDAGGIL